MMELLDELVIDSFAGGGGTSEGIVAALGRDPDIAVNHDRYALAMHRINHPNTRHLVEDVVTVDAISMCAGRPIGMLWMSPDCKDHSKAKGGKPRDKNIRGLAWSCLGWVKALPAWQRPRVVFLENVEEFREWGPLLENGKRCPVQKGAIFKQFVGAWEALGYKVEWRERRAWRAGKKLQAATIRKRLYVIMRRDGKPIVWPEPYFGNPNDPADAAKIAAGQLRPWKTAADCIDWSLPCPSIFATSAEIKEQFGIRANRPLAESTMARIAKGVMRYVVNSARPFIVSVTHKGDTRANSADEPLRTITSAHRGEHAVVTPFVVRTDMTSAYKRNGVNSSDEPLRTQTTAGSHAVVAPVLVGCGGRAGQTEPKPADEPIITQTGKADLCVASAFMVPRYQERPGQQPRTRSVELPLATVVPGGNEGHLAAVHLATMRNAQKPFNEADKPLHTLTAGGANISVVAAFLAQHTAGSHPGAPAKAADEPVSTITSKGSQQSVVAAHMLNLRGSDRRDAPADEPLRTLSAQGKHAAAVYAFLIKYYGNEIGGHAVDEPIGAITTRDRAGLVTVSIAGEPYVIVDIGMRMLTPRERFTAQGFRPDYIIDRGVLEDGTIIKFTAEQQGYMCGNSVCPPEAEDLISANYQPRKVRRPYRAPSSAPLLEAAE